jgi:hypothetical protein
MQTCGIEVKEFSIKKGPKYLPMIAANLGHEPAPVLLLNYLFL